MNKRENYMNQLNEIKSMANKIKKINENIAFEDEYEFNDPDMEQGYEDMDAEGQEELSKADAEQEGMSELDANGSLDTIREITLKGMTKLCKTPENPEFQALLKIFQICNKGAEQPKDEEKKPQI